MSNLWQEFTKLMPSTPVLTGQAVETYSDGSVLLNIIGGGRARVFDGGIPINPGDRYFFAGNSIISVAPAMNVTEIEVF